MKLKTVTSLCAMMLMSLAIQARQLSVTDALARLTEGNSPAKGVSGVRGEYVLEYTQSDDSNNLLYVFNNKTANSYVIASADDLAPAVLAYSNDGLLDVTDINGGVRFWMDIYSDAISKAIKTGNPVKVTALDAMAIEPLVKTKWGQDTPFNNLCPLSGGKRCVTGCVPTASSMLMYYHKCGNFDWSVIQENYGYYRGLDGEWHNASYTTASANEVARMMYTVGSSINAKYGAGETSSSAFDAVRYLTSYQGFDKSARYANRAYYTDEEWQNLLLSELQQARPMIYDGRDKYDNGHAFMCDGYDGKGYFHFNWGWQGSSDGYYLVIGSDPLNPYVDEKGEGMGYAYDTRIFYNLKPNEGTEDYELRIGLGKNDYYFISNVYTNNKSYAIESCDRNARVCFSYSVSNFGIDNAKVYYGLKFTNKSTNDVYWDRIDEADINVLGRVWGYLGVSLGFVEKNGTYKVSMIVCPKSKNPEKLENWKEVTLQSGEELPDFTVVGTEHNLKLLEPAYVTRFDNMTTLNNITCHLKIKALQNVSNQMVVAWVFPEGGGQNITYFMTTVTMKAGEEKELTIPVSQANLLKEGTEYTLRVDNYNAGYTLTPNLYSNVAFKVVDKKTFDGLKGDANGDGVVTMDDANAVINYSLGNKLADFHLYNADVNGDKAITKDDANAIVDVYLGKKK